MNLLIDTDVVLDLLLKRQPFFADAFTLWQAADQGRFERYVAAITPINVFYIARKANGAAAAHRVIDELLAVVRVAPVDAAILQAASISGFADFEDAVQIAEIRPHSQNRPIDPPNCVGRRRDAAIAAARL